MLALVQFMLILDVTVVNVALPNIQKDLNFGPTGLAWVVDGYVLTAGGLLLLGGRLSDLVGRKRLFLIGVAIFGVTSITCGLAQNPAMLVTSRFIQGTGEALAAPAALGLVALLFPDPARAHQGPRDLGRHRRSRRHARHGHLRSCSPTSVRAPGAGSS